MTSYQRRCDEMTSNLRRYDVILAPYAQWERFSLKSSLMFGRSILSREAQKVIKVAPTCINGRQNVKVNPYTLMLNGHFKNTCKTSHV